MMFSCTVKILAALQVLLAVVLAAEELDLQGVKQGLEYFSEQLEGLEEHNDDFIQEANTLQEVTEADVNAVQALLNELEDALTDARAAKNSDLVALLREARKVYKRIVMAYQGLQIKGERQSSTLGELGDLLDEDREELNAAGEALGFNEDESCWELVEDKSTINNDECSDEYWGRLFNTHDNISTYPELDPFYVCTQDTTAQYMYVEHITDPQNYNDYDSAIYDCFKPQGFCPASIDHLTEPVETWQEAFYFFNGRYYGSGPFTRFDEDPQRLVFDNIGECRHDSLVLSGSNRWRIGHSPQRCEYDGNNFFYRRVADVYASCNAVPRCGDEPNQDHYDIYRRVC